jgi:hypothetical protein
MNRKLKSYFSKTNKSNTNQLTKRKGPLTRKRGPLTRRKGPLKKWRANDKLQSKRSSNRLNKPFRFRNIELSSVNTNKQFKIYKPSARKTSIYSINTKENCNPFTIKKTASFKKSKVKINNCKGKKKRCSNYKALLNISLNHLANK